MSPIDALALVMTGRFPASGIGRAVQGHRFLRTGGHEVPHWWAWFSPWLAVKSPDSWPSNLPPGVCWGSGQRRHPLEGRGDDLGTVPSKDRPFRTCTLEGHKRARGRPHEHDVGVFGFLQGLVADRGLTPSRRDTDGRENFVAGLIPVRPYGLRSRPVCGVEEAGSPMTVVGGYSGRAVAAAQPSTTE